MFFISHDDPCINNNYKFIIIIIYNYIYYNYVIVRTHFTVITCFNVARGRVNKG